MRNLLKFTQKHDKGIKFNQKFVPEKAKIMHLIYQSIYIIYFRMEKKVAVHLKITHESRRNTFGKENYNQ